MISSVNNGLSFKNNSLSLYLHNIDIQRINTTWLWQLNVKFHGIENTAPNLINLSINS